MLGFGFCDRFSQFLLYLLRDPDVAIGVVPNLRCRYTQHSDLNESLEFRFDLIAPFRLVVIIDLII